MNGKVLLCLNSVCPGSRQTMNLIEMCSSIKYFGSDPILLLLFLCCIDQIYYNIAFVPIKAIGICSLWLFHTMGQSLILSFVAVLCLFICLVQSVQLKKKAFHDWCFVAVSMSLEENLLNVNMFRHYPKKIPSWSQMLPVCPFNREDFCLFSRRTTAEEYTSLDWVILLSFLLPS